MAQSKLNAKLIAGILEEYGDDPHLGTPNPQTITAIAEAVGLMCQAAKGRHASEAKDSWNTMASYSSLIRGRNCALGGDIQGVPQIAYAILFLVFSHMRYQSDLQQSTGDNN